jgi:hypothetical protein
MKKITTLFAVAMLASSVFAGPVTYDKGSKGVVPPAAPESCFGPGFDIGIFGSALFPKDSRDSYDNGGGGGLLVDYFFCNYVGIEASYAINSTASGLHTYGGDLILRAPIESICLAPYLMVGGGGDTDGRSEGQWNAGAGLDLRFRGSPLGIFADAAYYWHSDDNRDRDYTMVRAGIKWKL